MTIMSIPVTGTDYVSAGSDFVLDCTDHVQNNTSEEIGAWITGILVNQTN